MKKSIGEYTASSMPSAYYSKNEYGLNMDIIDRSFLNNPSNDENSWLHSQEVDSAGFWTSYIDNGPIVYGAINLWNFDNINHLLVIQAANTYYSY